MCADKYKKMILAGKRGIHFLNIFWQAAVVMDYGDEDKDESIITDIA